jgi:hypothetical protein
VIAKYWELGRSRTMVSPPMVLAEMSVVRRRMVDPFLHCGFGKPYPVVTALGDRETIVTSLTILLLCGLIRK